MKTFKEIEGKEVISSDGRMLGKVADLVYDEELIIEGVVLKMNREILEDIGEDKPLLTSPKLLIELQHVKALSDKVILNEPFDELHIYFKDITGYDLVTGLIGMDISGSDGADIGKVTDLLVDTENWMKPHILVKLNKDLLESLSINRSLLSKTRLGISMTHVVGIADVVMLDTSLDEMDRIIQDESIKKV